ncbi:hypothetical protein N2604_20950 [Bradyrhizobium sp. CB1015]|nr:hypothetical protein N2604_20950 [Bradyrhizobium sp. CB1015]
MRGTFPDCAALHPGYNRIERVAIRSLILPIHFPAPTVGLIKPFGAAFDYRFKRE